MEVISESAYLYVDGDKINTIYRTIMENTRRQRSERWVCQGKTIPKEEVWALFEKYEPRRLN